MNQERDDENNPKARNDRLGDPRAGRQRWEFNLRLKTDSSERGPAIGQPVLVGAGMMGDRAQVVFSHPRELPAFVTARCD